MLTTSIGPWFWSLGMFRQCWRRLQSALRPVLKGQIRTSLQEGALPY